MNDKSRKNKTNRLRGGAQVPGRKSGANQAYFIPNAPSSGREAALNVRGRERRARRKTKTTAERAAGRSGKSAIGVAPLQQSFVAHLRASRRPFDGEKVLPFHTYNPEPTLIATPGFASSLMTFTVPPGNTLWVALGSTNNHSVQSEYYGRTYSPAVTMPDGTLSTTVAGPLEYSGFHAAALGYAQMGTAPGLQTNLVPFGTTVYGFKPTTAFPVPASSGSGTLRWVPIVWGVRIRRVSKLVDAAGSWHTTLPPNRVGLAAAITDNDVRDIGSYKIGGSEGGSWAVPARPADLVYSRCDYNSVVVDFQFTDPAFTAYYYNGSTSDVSYEVELCLKYAVGGKSINAIGTPVDHSPQHANVLEAVSSAITNGVAPSHMGESLAKVAHEAVGTGKSVMTAIQKAAKLDFSFADDLTKVL